MPRTITFQKGLSSVLFWSVISAAFIGPGTVTTASSAGATYGLSLLWALLFSTIATILLQEAAARITIASGKNLGEIIALKYGGNKKLRLSLFVAVAFGCAAYQTGNILGALQGLRFIIFDIPDYVLAIGIALFSFSILWGGSISFIAKALGAVVALMGIAFCWVALTADINWVNVIKFSILPSFPQGASLLIIGLIGTTIVPYNLFLASGIGKGQHIFEMRIGIAIAVLIGGIISAAILITGTQVEGTYSYEALATAMSEKLGTWAVGLFGFGLFAAGMSSAITAPLAAAITGQSLLGNQNTWHEKAMAFRLTWGIILLIGLGFSLLNVRPIPAIILAQAINGVLLPIVAIFLILAVNDRRLLPEKFTNKIVSNVVMLLIVGITCYLGLTNIWRAVENILPILKENHLFIQWLNLFLSIAIMAWVGFLVFRKQKA